MNYLVLNVLMVSFYFYPNELVILGVFSFVLAQRYVSDLSKSSIEVKLVSKSNAKT